MSVSIVSSTYRSVVDTERFIRSAYDMTQESFELIMAVNGRVADDLATYLTSMERSGRIKLVWNPSNIGVRSFNQVMRLASSEFIFRCDSDIEIMEPYWVKKMRTQWAVSCADIGNVVAVGTANTGGVRIQRSSMTTETDIIMSNCMLIHRGIADTLTVKLNSELPRMQNFVTARLKEPEHYSGEHEDLKATLEYVKYHAPYWDPQFGGPSEALGYGSDDIWWSLLARWSGLKLVTSTTKVVHRDASMRKGYESERHRLVARGFQYLRTSLSLIMDCWDQKDWNSLPNNLPVLVSYRNSGHILG